MSRLAAKQTNICDAASLLRMESGIGLFEVIAGTLVATLAVVGLAYSFGIGRGLIDRYLVARRAVSCAEMALDSLVTVAPIDLTTASEPFWSDGANLGTINWSIGWVDDPVDGSSGSDPNPHDMKRITVRVSWTLGGMSDAVQLSRIVNAP